MIPRLSGGAYRRPGSMYEAEVSNATEFAPRLIPFVYSETEAYCLWLEKISGGNGVFGGARASSNIAISATPATSGTHPWLYNELREVQHVQSADVLYLVHGSRKPQRISRTAVDTFSIAAFDNGLTGATFRDAWPYRAQNTTATTMSISNAAVGAGRTLTASTAFFSALHVGAVFKQNNAGTIGCCRVTAFVSSTQVTVEVMVAFGATAAVTTWWESAWSDYRGWPRTITFFKQRLVYGGPKDTLNFSESGDYNQLSHDTIVDPEASNGPTGSQAFQFTLNSERLNLIQWLSAKKTLVVGTSGDEFVIDKAFQSTTTGFGGDNIAADPQSSYGSMYLQPQRAGEEILFGMKSKGEVRALVFNNDAQQSYVAEPVQLFFDHYPKVYSYTGDRSYRQFAWDESRKTLWCCDTAGNLFGMTRDKRLGVTAWHTHQMGGYDSTVTGSGLGGVLTDSDATLCAGSVVSVAVVPNPALGVSDVWVVVKRKINSIWKYQIERIIGGEFQYDTAYGLIQNGVGNYFSDASVFSLSDYPAPEDYEFSGLTHLRGETVEGAASGSYGMFSVEGSAVTAGGLSTIQKPYPGNIASEAVAVCLGLGFDSRVEPVRPEAGSQIGSSQGAIKRIHKLNVRFYRTLSAKVGADEDNLETVIFREGSTPMGKSPELFSGDKEILLDSDYDKDGYVLLLQDKPLPFAITSIAAEGQTYD